MHWPYSSLSAGVAMNCDRSQRFASWSYSTTGSPSLCVLHSPSVLAQSWLIGVAPRSTWPVFEKTAKSVFTIWTYWVEPTSPSVSGGRQLQLLGSAHGSPNGRQMPSKFWIGPEIGPEPLAFWITGSFAPGTVPLGLSDSIPSVCSGACGTGNTGSEATSGEVPWKLPLITCGPAVAVEASEVPVTDEEPPLLARAIPKARVAFLLVVSPPELTATAAIAADDTTSSTATAMALRGTCFRISTPPNCMPCPTAPLPAQSGSGNLAVRFRPNCRLD